MLKSLKTSFLLMVGLLLVLVFPTASWAHSKLESSVPAADAKLKENVTELSLSFNENIDENLSTLKVKNEQGGEVELSGTHVTGNTLSGTLSEPLPTGAYTVEWKIVGGDGHPVDGTYSFEVEVPETESEPAAATDTEEPPAEATQDGDESTDQAPAEQTPADSSDETPNTDANQQADADAEPEQSGGGNPTVWIIIVLVPLIAAYFGIKASRKRK